MTSRDATESLAEFVKKNNANFTLAEIDKHQKEAILKICLEKLATDKCIEEIDCFSCIRILSRDEQCMEQLAEDGTITHLFKYAFPPDANCNEEKTLEALKALSNIIFKRSTTIPHLRNLGILAQLIQRLQTLVDRNYRGRILLVDLKILFILSGLEPDVRSELANDAHAFGLLSALLRTFQTAPLSSMDVEIICEALKANYNIGYALQRDLVRSQSHVQQFTTLIPTLRDLLPMKTCVPQDHFMLVNQIVNFLNVVPRRCFKYLLYPCAPGPNPAGDQESDKQMLAIDILLDFLTHQLDLVNAKDHCQSDCSNLRSDELLCPIFNALIKGAQGCKTIRKYCRMKILPYLGNEVRKLPEEGATLRNRLCKLLTHPLQGVSELDALLLFVLCKEDIGRAVKYTGFGNFAGFLARHALLGRSSKKRSRATDSTANSAQTEEGTSNLDEFKGDAEDDSCEEYSTGSSASDTEEYAKLRDNVNPVTGRWELPRPNPMEGMSEEQKEYTAMELVNQIDRLQRSGLIQPGVIGDDGRVRPAEHVLELLENNKNTRPTEDTEVASDDE